ncbi:hypothetical protein EMCG_06648 [[Emmonsia] crescens]|uniref:Uncharacterized protein n=1 Tax=[Emmonsia] crescens TaxID=73230 RepID=A0A0G2J6F5_9EURO|nr:hypothetical protein EMCG_06648 [Emmonsia crescens UAMH 3008]
MRLPPPSLLRKLTFSSTSPLRRDLHILRTFPSSPTTISTLPTAKARANFSTTRRILLSNSSSRQSPTTADKQRRHQRGAKKNGANEHASQDGNPEFPTLSFEGLGLSRNMKIVVLGLVGVLGTMEAWFWCKAIRRWWKGIEEERDEEYIGGGERVSKE